MPILLERFLLLLLLLLTIPSVVTAGDVEPEHYYMSVMPGHEWSYEVVKTRTIFVRGPDIIHDIVGDTVIRIEGLSSEGDHPVQLAWKEFDVPQCGYCQSGMIMSVLALLQKSPNPTDAEIDADITNICRCSTYHRVRQAIHRAAELIRA